MALIDTIQRLHQRRVRSQGGSRWNYRSIKRPSLAICGWPEVPKPASAGGGAPRFKTSHFGRGCPTILYRPGRANRSERLHIVYNACVSAIDAEPSEPRRALPRTDLGQAGPRVEPPGGSGKTSSASMALTIGTTACGASWRDWVRRRRYRFGGWSAGQARKCKSISAKARFWLAAMASVVGLTFFASCSAIRAKGTAKWSCGKPRMLS